ncbi:hypothetical protein HU200_045918 [Digitaria exilis]|uniref:Transposase MuDR plant domain-containing protein n=1 Tax=Digitaria exilis TaxID=1010633 RepID=A0A835AZ40_9POAL|nr:hypothetical protein HU200_045918 [Digitaria exilis]
MDPNSTFQLKVRLFGNKMRMREDYICGYLEMFIDSDLTNYMDLVKEIVEKRPPGYLEVAHFQYYDDVLRICPELKSDQDLMSMFEKHSKTKVVQMLVSYCDPSEQFEPFQEWPFQDNVEEDDTYLCNPLPENEHVGVDEEILYLEKAHVETIEEDKEKEYVPEEDDHFPEDEGEDESDLDIESESELEPDQELVEQVANLEFDKEDPPMEVGSTYPSMAEFKLALQTYAIKHEFEYNTAKSAPYRFTAFCSRKVKDNCQWRLHASVKMIYAP